MRLKDLQIPFVRGMDVSGAPKAYSETGKLRVVKNLRIKPGRKDALGMRNYAYAVARLQTSAITPGRVFPAAGKFHHISPIQARCLASGETGWQITSRLDSTTNAMVNADLLAVARVGGKPFTSYADSCSAMAVNSNGDELYVAGGMAGYDSTGTPTFQTFIQPVVNGVKRGAIALQSAVTSPTSHWRSIYAFPIGTNGFLIVRGSATGNTLELVSYNVTTDTLGTPVTSANSVVLDAVLTAEGEIAVLIRDVPTGYPFIRFYSASFSPTLSASVQVHAVGPVNPKCGGMSPIPGGSTMHVVLSQYDADSNTVRMWSINTSTKAVTAGGSLANPISGTHSTMAVCESNVSGESWCYVAGLDNTIAALLNVTSSTVTLAMYAPRVWPSARLFLPPVWVEDLTRKPWVAGTLGTQVGVWAFSAYKRASAAATTASFGTIVMLSATRGVYQSAATTGFACGGSMYNAGSSGMKVIVPTNTGHEVLSIGWSPTRGVPAEHSGMAFLPMGYPRYWDKERWVPTGFYSPPMADVSASAGGSLTAGSYSVAFVWEWTDAEGRRQQSASSTYVVVAAASQKLDITLKQYSIPTDERIMLSPNAPYVVEYRTSAGGTLLRRVKEIPLPASIWSAATWSATDGLSDSAIASNEILYTSGGGNELLSFGMEACDFAAPVSDRIMWHSPSYPAKVFYSKSLRPGRPFEFNPALSFDLPEAITALTSQDGNAYAGSLNNIYAFVPQYANDDGTTGKSTSGVIDSINIGQGVGIMVHAGTVAIPVGIMIMSNRGIFLIPRGGGPVEFIGEDVPVQYPAQSTYANAGVACIHNPWTSEVAFLPGPNILVYNYVYRQWFTWVLYEGTAATFNNGGFVNPANAFFYFSDAELTLARLEYEYYGVDTGYLSGTIASANVEVRIETGDIALHDFGGRTRVNRVAVDLDSGISNPSIAISESTDQGTTWSNEQSIALGSPNEPVVYQVLSRKSEGIAFRIRSTSASVPTGFYGITISAKSLGKPQLPQTNRKG